MASAMHHPTVSRSCCSDSPACDEASSINDTSSSSSKSNDGTSGRSRSDASASTTTKLAISAPPRAGEAEDRSRSKGGTRHPPLSRYWFSPFSFWQIWGFRLQIAVYFLYGGLVGWPAAASAALLPQALLRLFTLGGCGLLLLYDCFSGLRWISTRLLKQQQQRWVQKQLEILLHTNEKDTREAITKERQRLRQLVAAMLRCLSSGQGPTGSSAPPTAVAEPLAAEADAAAQVAIGGDLRMAAALYGVPRQAVGAALAAARLQHAKATRLARKQRRGLPAAAVAAVGAAATWAWGTARVVTSIACCALLVSVFIDLPASAAVAAANGSAWCNACHWLLPLLHATARGCLTAAAMNLHVGAYTELAVVPLPGCICTSKCSSNSSSSSRKCRNNAGCVLERPPKRWNLHRRLFFAFLLPIVCSIVAALASTAAAAGKDWELLDLLRVPLALLQFMLQLLPPEVSSLLPLHQQRSEAAERLLLLLEQQQALGWLRWPQAAAAGELLLSAALLTAAVAAASRCKSPPFLWKEHASLEQAAATVAAKKLLGKREMQLRKQNLCSRIGSRCRWMWECILRWLGGIHVRVGRTVRVGCVFMLGLMWVLLLLGAVSDLPLLRTDEGEPQTPWQFLQEQLQKPDMQQAWVELKQIKAELDRRTKEEGYERAFDWLFRMIQDSWNQQLEAERNETEAYAEALELFGLDEDATAADIRHKYRQLAKQHHPDLAGTSTGGQGLEGGATACGESGDPDASETCKASHEFMQKINLAYEVLLGQAGGKAAGLKKSAEQQKNR